MTGLTVAPVASKAARYAVTNWHYSGGMPTPPCACYGAWEDQRYVGAVVFSPGASQHLCRQFGLAPRQVCELTRVALRAHDHHVSEIVSRAVALLRKDSLTLDLLVSFADPEHAHHGGIYQAMNWLYLGTSSPSVGYRDRSGASVHARVVTNDGWTTQYGQRKRGHVAADLQRVTLAGKHRYALPLTRQMRKALLPNVLPYPGACGEGIKGDTAGVQPAGAGSVPARRSADLVS